MSDVMGKNHIAGYDAGQLHRMLEVEFPFYDLILRKLGSGQGYPRRVEDFELSTRSSQPEFKGNMTYEAFQEFLMQYFEKGGFRPVPQESDPLRGNIKFRKGSVELLLSMDSLENGERIGVFVFENMSDEAGQAPYPVMHDGKT